MQNSSPHTKQGHSSSLDSSSDSGCLLFPFLTLDLLLPAFGLFFDSASFLFVSAIVFFSFAAFFFSSAAIFMACLSTSLALYGDEVSTSAVSLFLPADLLLGCIFGIVDRLVMLSLGSELIQLVLLWHGMGSFIAW